MSCPDRSDAQLAEVREARSAFLRHLAVTILHPSAVLFIPPLLAFLPAYPAAQLAAHTFPPPGEEEGKAQWLAVCGGIVYGGVAGTFGFILATLASRTLYWQAFSGNLPVPRVAGALGTLAVVYCTVWALFRWHNALVHGESVPLSWSR